jgi:uncharacterized protein (DUF1778 family)
MVWAALATALIIVFAGGAGGEIPWMSTMCDLASDVIDGGERLSRAEEAAAAVKETIAAFEQNVLSHRAELVALDQDYYATAADYRRVLDTLDQAWRERMTKLIELRFKFRDQFTRAEWTDLIHRLDEKLKGS